MLRLLNFSKVKDTIFQRNLLQFLVTLSQVDISCKILNAYLPVLFARTSALPIDFRSHRAVICL